MISSAMHSSWLIFSALYASKSNLPPSRSSPLMVISIMFIQTFKQQPICDKKQIRQGKEGSMNWGQLIRLDNFIIKSQDKYGVWCLSLSDRNLNNEIFSYKQPDPSQNRSLLNKSYIDLDTSPILSYFHQTIHQNQTIHIQAQLWPLIIFYQFIIRHPSNYRLMGNITDKIAQNKYQLSLLTLAASWLAFLKYTRHQNQQLRRIATSIDPELSHISKTSLQAPSTLSLQSICSQFVKYKKNSIYRIALTGGPCAGKSTALQSISKHFTKSGFKVLLVPEVPTIVGVGGGLSDFPKYNTRDVIQFQTDIIKFKIYFEDYITRLAEMNKQPCLILCDRGIADCAAYMSRESYQAVLDEEGWTWSGLRDKRYDSVIFMNTAADGAEQYYTLANNTARHETAEQARALDKRTLNAWIGHPYMTICPNIKGKPFQYKVDMAIKAVQKTIGLQSTDIIYHKYLVQVQPFPQNIQRIESQIEQIYLRNDNLRFVQDKIKKRSQDKSFTYQRKFVGPYNPHNEFREVVRVSINSLQYETLSQQTADPFYKPIKIKRVNFAYKNVYFSLDRHEYIKDYNEAILLRFQAGTGSDVLPLIPPWIRPIKDVRLEEQFKLSSIALKQY